MCKLLKKPLEKGKTVIERYLINSGTDNMALISKGIMLYLLSKY